MFQKGDAKKVAFYNPKKIKKLYTHKKILTGKMGNRNLIKNQ